MPSSPISKKLERVKLQDLKPYKNNPRKNERSSDEVATSIKECGYDNPIVVDEALVVLAGHTRLKALKKLGKTEAEVLIISGLTEEQKRKYRLLDNKTGEIASWDFDALSREADGLDFSQYSFDILPEVEEPKQTEAVEEHDDGFKTLSLSVHAEQKAVIERCMNSVVLSGDYGNLNKHGNQLYQVIKEWAIENALID